MTRTPLLISLALATVAAVATAKPAPAVQAAPAAKPAAAAVAPAPDDRTPRYDWRRVGIFDSRVGKMILAPDLVNGRALGFGQGC